MANNVIGYKGSAKQRLESWNTLLLLRSSMEYSRSKGMNPCLEREVQWYEEEFDAYRKSA